MMKRDPEKLLLVNDFSMVYKTDHKFPKQFHSHPGYELVWMMDGEAQYTFEDKVYHVAKGQLLLFKGSVFHKVHVQPNQTYNRCVIHFTRSFFPFEHEVLTEFERILERLPAPHDMLQLLPDEARALQQVMDRLLEESDSEDRWGKRGAIQIRLLELLLFVCRAVKDAMPGLSSPVQLQQDKVEMLERILRELGVVWHTAWSLDALANRLHINKFYLCHFFKRELGMTIQQYILQKRFHEAQKLLVNTDLTVREIAQRVGFDNDSNFIRSFKNHTKTTPKLYRESTVLHNYKL